MTLFSAHPDRRRGQAAGSRFSIARAFQRLRAVLRMIHQGIAAAKIHRLRSELMFRAHHRGDWPELRGENHGELPAGKFPQQPLVLGDKWDF